MTEPDQPDQSNQSAVEVPSDEQPAAARLSGGAWVIIALVITLLILHQDNWFWTDDTLVFGFLPIGLFWHACISVAAAATWFLATRIAWPIEESTVPLSGSGTTEGRQ